MFAANARTPAGSITPMARNAIALGFIMTRQSSGRVVTQPSDPGRALRVSVRLSFWFGGGDQGPLSGAVA